MTECDSTALNGTFFHGQDATWLGTRCCGIRVMRTGTLRGQNATLCNTCYALRFSHNIAHELRNPTQYKDRLRLHRLERHRFHGHDAAEWGTRYCRTRVMRSDSLHGQSHVLWLSLNIAQVLRDPTDSKDKM